MKIFDEEGLIDSDVQDILYELGNVGLGMASITMGNLMGVRMHIGVPSIVLADEHLKEKLKSSNNKIGVLMEFQKTLKGYMVFLLDQKFVSAVADKMCKNAMDSFDYEDELSAVHEFANLICAAYLKAIGQYTGIRTYVKPVEMKMDCADLSIFNNDTITGPCERIICVDADFNVQSENGDSIKDVGNVIMLPFEESVEKLIEPLCD